MLGHIMTSLSRHHHESMMDRSIHGHVTMQRDSPVLERMSDERIHDFICRLTLMTGGSISLSMISPSAIDISLSHLAKILISHGQRIAIRSAHLSLSSIRPNFMRRIDSPKYLPDRWISIVCVYRQHSRYHNYS